MRQVVGATSANTGKQSGDAFAMPPIGDPSVELLRGLAILADRDVQRAYIAGITACAGVDLPPAAAWLLLRIVEEPALDIRALADRYSIDLEHLHQATTLLRARGYIVAYAGRPMYELTAEGCRVVDRLIAARRERLTALYREWPEAQRAQLAAILQRLAQELVPPRAA